MENLILATPAVSGGLQQETKIFEGLKTATGECSFVSDTLFCELKTYTALYINVSLALSNLMYNTCTARGQTSYAHNVFWENGERQKAPSGIVAPREHGASLFVPI